MLLPVLHTERLVLKKLCKDDVQTIFFLRSDEGVNQYIDRLRPKNTSDAEDFIQTINEGIHAAKLMYWAIYAKEAEQMIGTICLWNFSEDHNIAEVGYEMLPNHQGNGFMREALDTVTDYGFATLRLNAVKAYTHKSNQRSIKLLTGKGFVLVPTEVDENNLNNAIFILRASD